MLVRIVKEDSYKIINKVLIMNTLCKKIIIFTIIVSLTGISTCQAKTLDLIEGKSKLENNSLDLSDEQLFDLKVKLNMLKGHLPSISACIIKNDSIVWSNNYGYSRYFGFKKPTMDTVYSVYSLTKPITATALMQLYEQGELDLDDDINDYLDFNVRHPNYPNVPITFRMLLAHQSSLGDNSIPQSVYMNICFRLRRIAFGYPYPMIKEIIQPDGRLYNSMSWKEYKPGANCAYSNLNYILLEYLIEILSNQSYQDYCKENIFEPLDMKNSSFDYSDFDKNQLAVLYENIGNLHIRLPFLHFPYGAGGLKTTMSDMSHFLIAHMNDGCYKNVQILNKSSIEEMHKLQYPNSFDGEIKRYALGWENFNSSVHGVIIEGHEGRYLGGSAAMMMNSTNNIGFIFCFNKMLHMNNPLEYNAYLDLLFDFTKKATNYIT